VSPPLLGSIKSSGQPIQGSKASIKEICRKIRKIIAKDPKFKIVIININLLHHEVMGPLKRFEFCWFFNFNKIYVVCGALFANGRFIHVFICRAKKVQSGAAAAHFQC
jgi:hypothetical protein